jgi:biopolymer transport protein ExbD
MQLGWVLSDRDAESVVSLEGGRVAAADRLGGRTGFSISPLHEALRRWASPERSEVRVGLEIAPSVPYRTVSEVVYTLEQNGLGSIELHARVGDELRGHPVGLPQLTGAPALEEVSGEPLELTLTLTRAGAIVSGSDGRLAPGCSDLADSGAPTLPATDAGIDVDALQACLSRIRSVFPDEDTIVITAEPQVRYEHVLRAAAAAAGPDGELFPVTLLRAPLR